MLFLGRTWLQTRSKSFRIRSGVTDITRQRFKSCLCLALIFDNFPGKLYRKGEVGACWGLRIYSPMPLQFRNWLLKLEITNFFNFGNETKYS